MDYRESYFYRKKRNNARKRKIKISFIVILLITIALFFIPKTLGKSLVNEKKNPNENLYIRGPQLLFNHPNPQMRMALPLDIEANIEVNGLIAYAEIKQVFVNPHNIELEGQYQFPLPAESAVKYLSIKVADKEIIGKIMEKEAARKVYQKAKKQRKKAILMEQQRPNLFTNKIASIPAHSRVIVTLQLILPVTFTNEQFNFRLPLAMTTRYQPENFTKSPAQKTTTLLAPLKNLIAQSQASINVELNAGIPIESISSQSHKLKTRILDNKETSFLITLDKQKVLANRSFEISWQLKPSLLPQISTFSEKVDGEHFTLLTFFPPKRDELESIPRDIIFIIDTSGSMQGPSIRQAKSSLQQALIQLSEKDSFNIIAFNNTVDELFTSTKLFSQQNKRFANHFIENLNANGGTEMYRPLSKALVMKQDIEQSNKAIRQIIFITDGAVANEFELMQLLDGARKNFRLYTVGIGAAPNGYFMKKAAQFGRGKYVFIQNTHEIQNKISKLMTQISQPAVSDIQIILDNHNYQHLDIYPKHIPDLYLDEPMQVTIKSALPITSAQISGNTATLPWYHQVIVNKNQSSHGVSTLWARRKIEDLLDSLVSGANREDVKDTVIATSIAHQVISPYTSFIAVEKELDSQSMTAKHHKKIGQPSRNTLAKAHESLMVALPNTALNWQQQLFIGVLFLLLGKLANLIWIKKYANYLN